MGVKDDPNYKLSRSCWRKIGYRTSHSAQAQIKKIYKQKHLRLYKYRCSSCDQYHLTKDPDVRGKGVI